MLASPITAQLNIVPNSARAREYAENFKTRLVSMQQQVVQTPLAVLLWDPGGFNPALIDKRAQIRDELRQHEMAAYFSEELENLKNTALSPRVNAILQAAAADFIVCIALTFPAIARAADFADDTVIRRKLLVFVADPVPDEYRAAVARLREKYDSVQTYHFPNDIVSCHLKTIVLEKVSEMQYAKWRASNSPSA